MGCECNSVARCICLVSEFSQQRPPDSIVIEFANLRLLTNEDRGVRVALSCRGALAQCRREKDCLQKSHGGRLTQ